jgi:hypothetical protein
MRVVCLSCFDESKRDSLTAIEKVKQWIELLKKPSEFIQIGNTKNLLDALSDQTTLKGVDVLILAAHGYSDGNFQMRDGTAAAASDVVGALKKGALPEKAVLFVFACNGAKSGELLSLFPANGRGPRMIFGATRLALSNPMKNAIKSVVEAVQADEMDVDRAKSIADNEKACQIDAATNKVTSHETPFLCVLWGPNERYAPG